MKQMPHMHVFSAMYHQKERYIIIKMLIYREIIIQSVAGIIPDHSKFCKCQPEHFYETCKEIMESKLVVILCL